MDSWAAQYLVITVWIKKRRDISTATAAYGKLQLKVWERHGIRLITKCKVYLIMVFTYLLYSAGTYILCCRHIRRLQNTQMYQMRYILKIRLLEQDL